MTWFVILLIGLVMGVGLVSVIIPFVPGLVLIWGAGLAYGLLEGFAEAGWGWFVAMSVLTVVGLVATYALPGRAGVVAGATRQVLTAGVVGGIIGFFVIPVVGLPLGAVLGVLVAEYARTADWARAWELTKQVLIGFGMGVLAEFGAGLAMIFVWVGWVFAAR